MTIIVRFTIWEDEARNVYSNIIMYLPMVIVQNTDHAGNGDTQCPGVERWEHKYMSVHVFMYMITIHARV